MGTSYLLVHGESPYDIRVLFDDGSLAVWLPSIIGAFFPLGFLPLQQASNLWLLINIIAIISMMIFVTQHANQKPIKVQVFGFLLIIVFVFPPTVTNLLLGQADFVLMAALMASAWGIQNQNAPITAFGFVLAISKPQLVFVLLPSVFIWLFLTKQWKYGLRLLTLMVFIFGGLTIPLWVAEPNWIQDFLISFGNNPAWLQPGPFSLLQVYLRQGGLLLWLLLAIGGMGFSTYLWHRLAPRQAVLWSLAITTIVAPYIWSWNFTLLLPLFTDTAVRSNTIYARVMLASSWIVSFFFYIWTRQITESDHRLWWLPIIMLVGIAVSLWIEYRSNPKSPLLNVYTQSTPLAIK